MSTLAQDNFIGQRETPKSVYSSSCFKLRRCSEAEKQKSRKYYPATVSYPCPAKAWRRVVRRMSESRSARRFEGEEIRFDLPADLL